MNKSRLRQNRLKELLKHDNIYAYTLSYSIVMMLDTVHQALSMGSFPMLNRVLKPNHSRILCLSLSLITWAISFQTELEAADLTPNNLVVERIGKVLQHFPVRQQRSMFWNTVLQDRLFRHCRVNLRVPAF